MSGSCAKAIERHDGDIVSEIVSSNLPCLTRIRYFRFKNESCDKMKNVEGGCDWPVVYIITNEKEVYIGETCCAYARIKNHLGNDVRTGLKEVYMVFNSRANKSATLDLEQSLIQLFDADGKFSLQNMNAGQSARHDYYMRDRYTALLPDIWNGLKNLGLANYKYDKVINSKFYRYSPFTALTPEQDAIAKDVLSDIAGTLGSGNNGTYIIRGSAGTGKTVLATSIMLSLSNAARGVIDETQIIEGFMDDGQFLNDIYTTAKKIIDKKRMENKKAEFKIGFVVPMESLRMTLEEVFDTIHGLKGLVIGPYGVPDSKDQEYDVLVVDESHRLAHYDMVPFPPNYVKKAKKLGMDFHQYTQLDWIMSRSKYQVLFYDSDQTVRESDLTNEEFQRATLNAKQATLRTQLRCRGGDSFLDYVSNIFSCSQESKERFDKFEFKQFSDVEEMVQAIKDKNEEMQLCRCVAGYSWKWKTRSLNLDEIKKSGEYDIEIDGHRYIWNMSNEEWILRGDSINEIGCIHTSQGYDMNYVGVIFGLEIDYDEKNKRIIIDSKKFYDKGIKKGCDEETLRTYIINAYRVMLTRGIKGCYVYACNPGLAKYLSKYIDA